MDKNLKKAYELYNLTNATHKIHQEELDQLRLLVMKWMPNFHKYGKHESFKEGIRYITEDYMIQPEEEARFWGKQEVNQHFDKEDKMWGISPRNGTDHIHFNGHYLRDKYSAAELWLRSDICRLTKVFNVATPEKVELESIGS